MHVHRHHRVMWNDGRASLVGVVVLKHLRQHELGIEYQLRANKVVSVADGGRLSRSVGPAAGFGSC
jgi:hypothetical protein